MLDRNQSRGTWQSISAHPTNGRPVSILIEPTSQFLSDPLDDIFGIVKPRDGGKYVRRDGRLCLKPELCEFRPFLIFAHMQGRRGTTVCPPYAEREEELLTRISKNSRI